MESHKTTSLHVAERDMRHTCRVKDYPGGRVEVMASSRPIFAEAGWEHSGREADMYRIRTDEASVRAQASAEPSDVARARRRAAARVRDLALCNQFTHFVTLTFDGTKIDRYDIRAILKKMRVWLDNRVRRRGLLYILVPELHKDGAIHFHGFFNRGVDYVDSGTVRRPGSKKPRRPRGAKQRAEWLAAGGLPVYNVADWAYGFSTAIPLYGDYDAAVSYVCKYVTKGAETAGNGGENVELSGKIGGRWYYSGGELQEPRVSFCDIACEELAAAGGRVVSLADAYLTLCIYRGTYEEYERDCGRLRRDGGGVGAPRRCAAPGAAPGWDAGQSAGGTDSD